MRHAPCKRGKADRAALVAGWGGYMRHLTAALALLPKVAGVCYRGCPDKATAVAQYTVGRPVQWGGFSSTSTDFGVTQSFTDRDTGVIFKITVTGATSTRGRSSPQRARCC